MKCSCVGGREASEFKRAVALPGALIISSIIHIKMLTTAVTNSRDLKFSFGLLREPQAPPNCPYNYKTYKHK